MSTRILLLLALTLLLAPQGVAKVFEENTDQLPPGCDEIRGAEELTVHGGKHFAESFSGTIFTYDKHTYHFPACTRVTVTFVNNDSVRHQWMVHGLPISIHEMGMFNIEVTGPGNDTGTFITPSEPETLMVHCGVPQHEQKGMKAQVKVDGGTGNLAGIPGVSGKVNEFPYPRESHLPLTVLLLFAGILAGVVVAYAASRYQVRQWLAEEHDIHLTLGRFGLDIHTGPVKEAEDVTEEDAVEEEPVTDTEEQAAEDEDSGAVAEAEEDEEEPAAGETDGGSEPSTDGEEEWLEDEDDAEVGNW